MKNFRRVLLVTAIMLMTSLVFVGCSGAEKEISIAHLDSASSTASTYLVKNILETELNYTVTLNSFDQDAMWKSVADGESDFTVSAWLPLTQGALFGEFREEIVNIGPNYVGALSGLAVPSYVKVDKIDKLNEDVDKFGGQIIGIESSAGIMDITENAIETYELDFDLVESNEANMIAELEKAVDNEEWIIVTGWAPHWKFSQFDLKFLEDANNAFGAGETINSIARKDFDSDHSVVQKFLGKYRLNSNQLEELISMMEEHNDKDEAAQKWIEENKDLVESWLN